MSELGTPHTPVEIEPGTMERGSQFGEAYEQMVPNLRVPCIKDGEKVISGSRFTGIKTGEQITRA